MVSCIQRYNVVMENDEETRKLLREVLRSQTVEELVKQGFSRVEAEMIAKKDDINKEENENEEKEEEKEKKKDIIKRIAIEVSLEDV